MTRNIHKLILVQILFLTKNVNKPLNMLDYVEAHQLLKIGVHASVWFVLVDLG